jgi:hypothetical protein
LLYRHCQKINLSLVCLALVGWIVFHDRMISIFSFYLIMSALVFQVAKSFRFSPLRRLTSNKFPSKSPNDFWNSRMRILSTQVGIKKKSQRPAASQMYTPEPEFDDYAQECQEEPTYSPNFSKKNNEMFNSEPPTKSYKPVPLSPTLKAREEAALNYRTPVTIVDTVAKAQAALKILQKHPEAYWACDTEVVDINLKEESIVGKGNVICVSIYGGDHIDFGSGSTLWIDSSNKNSPLLHIFKEWFESPLYKKVWHNYGFDKHVVAHEGIVCQGFAGDTMHLARLWDTSRDKVSGSPGGDGYSLSALTELFFQRDDIPLEESQRFIKTSMKELFGIAKLKKDGSEGKIKDLPNLLELQNDPEDRERWIEYSARDAVATWWVRKKLVENLQKMPWIIHSPSYSNNNPSNADSLSKAKAQNTLGTMYDFYEKYWKEFGDLLTVMEDNGIKINKKALEKSEVLAREERAKYQSIFLTWLREYFAPEIVKEINLSSTQQLQQLFFGQYENNQFISDSKDFKNPKAMEQYEQELKEAVAINPFLMDDASELKKKCKEKGLKSSGSRKQLILRLYKHRQLTGELQALTKGELINRFLERKEVLLTLSTRLAPPPEVTDSTIPITTNTENLSSESIPKKKKPTASKKKIFDPEVVQKELQESRSILEKSTETTHEQILQAFLNQELAILKQQKAFLKKKKPKKTLETVVSPSDISEEGNINNLFVSESLQSKAVESTSTSNFSPSATATVEGEEPVEEEELPAIPLYINTNDLSSFSDELLPLSLPEGFPMEEPKKFTEILLTTLGMTPTDFTPTGVPQVTASVLQKLAGKNVFGEGKTERQANIITLIALIPFFLFKS